MFSKNLKYYRLREKLTKKELADLCDVSAMAITHYEKGTRRPSMETIKRMADVLHINVSDFLSSSDANISFRHNEFRKTNALSKSQIQYIQLSVEEYFNRFFNVIDLLGDKVLPDPIQVKVLEKSNDFEQDAKKLREILELSMHGPVCDLVSMLEYKGILIYELDYKEDNFYGLNGFINTRPYIVINKNMTPERKRSTLVHELVHIVFKDITNSKENEKYANAVSGAFLIGEEDIINEIGLKRKQITNDMLIVCKKYGISMLMLVTRLYQLNIISTNVYQQFYMRANQAGWRKNEPSRILWEPPKLFYQLVYRAIDEEDISIQKASELLNLSYSEVLEQSKAMEVFIDEVY